MEEKVLKRPKKKIEYNKACIYLFRSQIDGGLYKLHRVGFEKYTWVDLFSSSSYAFGIYNSAKNAFDGWEEMIIIFTTKDEFINYIKSL